MSRQTEELEDLVCLATTAFSMLEGYLGPQWFEAVHNLNLEGLDKVARAAAAITDRRSALTARQRTTAPEGGAA